MIVEALSLNEAKAVSSTGEDEKEWEQEENAVCLPPEKSSRYRALVARCNYLAADRGDIQFAVKELCRDMSNPTVRSWKRLKRLGRYLLGKPRMVQHYEWQGVGEVLEAYGASDWAGCKESGRSTSGGVIMIGNHVIKSWSRT